MASSTKLISALFYTSALYDGALGLAFLFFPTSLLEAFKVAAPHPGYIQFPAALLIVFALMFVSIARAPERRRDLMPYGILLKASYCGVVFWYWVESGIPFIWKPFAICDVLFGILFVWAYLQPVSVNSREVC